jgi:hypothetical protein
VKFHVCLMDRQAIRVETLKIHEAKGSFAMSHVKSPNVTFKRVDLVLHTSVADH